MSDHEKETRNDPLDETEALSARVFGKLFRGKNSLPAIDRGMWKAIFSDAANVAEDEQHLESKASFIKPKSSLDVADNSGARRVTCIKVLGGSKRKYASVGDIIVVSVKEAIPRGRVKKGDVRKAVVVRTAKAVTREDGTVIRSDRDAAVLLNNNGEPIGSRIFGPILASLLEGKLAALVAPEEQTNSEPLQDLS